MENAKSIYNQPAVYDIHFSEKKRQMLGKHYEVLFEGKNIKRIHDCSYGTGNLTDQLARMGYQVSGSDISEVMLSQAKEKNQREGLKIRLIESDFRSLSSNIKEEFDCVMSTGNSLAHVPNEDVKTALKEMSQLVKKGGYIYIDTRNWDEILATKQRFYYYPPYITEEERINTMQVWDYNLDGSITFNILYGFEKDGKIYKREEFQETYYPLKKDFLIEELTKLGFQDFEIWNLVLHQIKEFKDMEWYVILCKKSD